MPFSQSDMIEDNAKPMRANGKLRLPQGGRSSS
jgi:hypothetical protein